MPARSEYGGYEWAPDPARARADGEEWRAQERVRIAVQRQRRLREFAAEQQGLCTWCWHPLPSDLDEAEIDHIIPRCRGGPNVRWNLQLLHWRCNGRGRPQKGAKGISVTPPAEALAAEHGITITG